MPRKISNADIRRIWHVYQSIHGDELPTIEEIHRGLPKLVRIVSGETWKGPIIIGTGGFTRFVQVRREHDGEFGWELWVNRKSGWPAICRDLVFSMLDNPSRQSYFEYQLAKAVCERGWLAGKLLPDPKAKPAPTKQELRAAKIKRLEQRHEAWVRKRDRAINAIRKINRSLTALRRHVT